MIPLLIPALFGEHYQVLAQGQKAISCGIVVHTTDAARLFSILTRELMVPADHWRGFTTVLIKFKSCLLRKAKTLTNLLVGATFTFAIYR